MIFKKDSKNLVSYFSLNKGDLFIIEGSTSVFMKTDLAKIKGSILNPTEVNAVNLQSGEFCTFAFLDDVIKVEGTLTYKEV